MKFNRFIRIALTVSIVSALSLGANAQLKGMGNRLKNKVVNKVENKVEQKASQAVDKAVNKAEEKATQAVNKTTNKAAKKVYSEAEYKTQMSAPQLPSTYDIDDLYDVLEYWLDLQEMANKKKDLQWLGDDDKGRQATNYFNELQNNRSRTNARFHSWDETKQRFEQIADASNALLYEGYPDHGNYSNEEYLAKCLKWYVDKAKKNKGKAKQFYVVNGSSVRYLCFLSGKYKDTPAIQEQTKALVKLWDGLDSKVREANKNSDPHASYDNIMEQRAELDRQIAEEKAKAEAKRKAHIEANSMKLTPGSLNKTYNAQVLALAKNVEPGVIRVVVENNNWNVKRNAAGAILRRTFMAWIVLKDEEGNLIAKDYSFAQEYMGGGKYGKLKNYGVGMRSVYVK